MVWLMDILLLVHGFLQMLVWTDMVGNVWAGDVYALFQ